MLTRVWKRSSQKGGALLVLLAIADYADDRGEAYPSIGTLQAKSRLSERSVQAALGRLVAAGELAIQPQGGPHRVNLYRVLVTSDAADSAPRTNGTPQKTTAEGADFSIEGAAGCTQTVIEPSIEPVGRLVGSPRARARGSTDRPTNQRYVFDWGRR